MDKFPVEFSDFIKADASVWEGGNRLGTAGECVRWFPNLVKPAMAKQAIQLLEQQMAPHIRTWNTPIPKELITNLRFNFRETLPKTFRNDSVILNSTRSAAIAAAKKIGLLDMLGSQSLHRFAETVSGYKLAPDPGFQVSRYRAGDFVGPHNDHHPEDWNLRNGYVDLHITLTNPFVSSQYFIYEYKGSFNRVVDVAVPSGVTVSRLPYWHQVTPLIPKKNKEQQAERWLLLVSFSIAQKPNHKKS